MLHLENNPTTRWAIHFLALIGLVLALKYGQLMLLPVVISLMLATALWPLVSYLNQNWHLPRAVAGLMVMFGLVVFLGLFVAWAAFKVQEVYLQFPPVQNWFGRPVEIAVDNHQPGPAWETPYDRLHRRVAAAIDQETADFLFPPDPEQSFLYRNVVPWLTQQANALPDHLKSAAEQLLFIVFLVLFILVEGEMLMRRTTEVFGPATATGAKGVIRALQNMARQVRAYLLWRTFVNVGLALVLGFIYKYVLGLSNPWLWAILAGVLTYVPYIGPIVAGIPAVLDALMSSQGGVVTAVAVVILLIIIFTIEGYVIFPLVVGRNMEMNATTTLLACLFWWLVWGNIGLFLAMPLTGAIRAICQNVPGWEPWANLMSMDAHPPGSRGWIWRRVDALLGNRPDARSSLASPAADGEAQTSGEPFAHQ